MRNELSDELIRKYVKNIVVESADLFPGDHSQTVIKAVYKYESGEERQFPVIREETSKWNTFDDPNGNDRNDVYRRLAILAIQERYDPSNHQ